MLHFSTILLDSSFGDRWENLMSAVALIRTVNDGKGLGIQEKQVFEVLLKLFCCFIENILREKVEFRLQYWKIS